MCPWAPALLFRLCLCPWILDVSTLEMWVYLQAQEVPCGCVCCGTTFYGFVPMSAKSPSRCVHASLVSVNVCP